MAVYRWHTKGVPPERALQIEILTNGMVTRQDLRPDLFGLTALQQ
jgi:DNA-binding transcriptional regulator YdaS (Cro superfamily)